MWVCLNVRTNSNSWKEWTEYHGSGSNEDEGGGENSGKVEKLTFCYWSTVIL